MTDWPRRVRDYQGATVTPTLSDWLLAQIAEDEEKASLVLVQSVDTSSGVPQIKHTAIRERVLAECEAKRRIVDYREQAAQSSRDTGAPIFEAQVSAYDATLRALALPYADRPGYDEEWRP